MNRKQILYFIIAVLSCHLSYGQNFDVTYKGVFKPNKNDKSYVEEDIFMLHIRGNSSMYYSTKYQYMMTNQGKIAKDKVDISRISSNYFITKNGEKVIHHQAMLINIMNYEEKELPKWKILKEYKTIDSIECQKATTNFRGRSYTACFANSIPVSEGPYKFKNLPGLIIELSSNDGDYHYILAALKKADAPVDAVPSIPLKDRKHYLSELKKIVDNPSFGMQQQDMARGDFQQKDYINGVEVSPNEKYKAFNEMVWEFMKKHNNPIETDDIWIR